MNKAVAMKWAKALRSGKYKQTKHTLQDEHGYCCLGVLCEVAEKQGIRVTRNKGTIVGQDLDSQPSVARWAAIGSVGELCKEMSLNSSVYTSESTLTLANDDMCLTFDEIADVIENEWENIT